MDSFSPGGRFSQTHESLTNGTVDEIIRESSDDIDHRSIIDQWPPVGQRKQALERGLQTRRDPTTLQSIGILPPSKTPSTYYVEAQRLQRCKTKDFLNRQIGQRPDRQTLVEKHILEEGTVSPVLINQQKKFQRAQLADQLNMKMLDRPGPLDLIKRKILVPELPEETKEALLSVPYRPVSESEDADNILNTYSSEDSPPGSVQSSASSPTSQTDPFKNEFPHEQVQSIRPVSRSEPSRRSNSALRLKKKNNRSKFKFHVYTPSDKNNSRKDAAKNLKNVNYENRMQQQKIFLDMDQLQHHIEKAMPKAEVPELKTLHGSFIKPKPKNEVLILPSPTPSGDQLMHEIEQRQNFKNPISQSIGFKNGFSLPPPPPVHMRPPPTPPPLENIPQPLKSIEKNPALVNDLKVKGRFILPNS